MTHTHAEQNNNVVIIYTHLQSGSSVTKMELIPYKLKAPLLHQEMQVKSFRRNLTKQAKCWH